MEKYVCLVQESTRKINRAGSQMKIRTASMLWMEKQANEGINSQKEFTR
jgi:hypothetical protein